VDTMRDPIRVDAWRESLERSRARRGKPPLRPVERHQLGSPGADPPHKAPAHELPSYWRLCLRALAKRSVTLIMSAIGIVAVVLVAATMSSKSQHRSLQVSVTAARRHVARAAVRPSVANPGDSPESGPAEPTTCRLTDRSTGYVNPLSRANVVSERVDQGVDYAGSGALISIGAARIAFLATGNTGWPGAFIDYQLLAGPDRGCYVYYAEGVTPAPGLQVGETVRAGQAIATIIPNSSSGIEIGWASGHGTRSYAAEAGEWSAIHEANNIPSASGLYFSLLIASLGGPPGKVEG
jgi:hypothetical protein